MYRMTQITVTFEVIDDQLTTPITELYKLLLERIHPDDQFRVTDIENLNKKGI